MRSSENVGASRGMPMSEGDVESLRRRLVAAVKRTCPASLAAHVEDIVQNVLTQLVVLPGGGEGNRSFSSTYLSKAAYGATVDEIRRMCRRRESAMGDDSILDRTPDAAAGPERQAASTEIARGIQDCLTHLVRPRRLAVTLYLEGCSVPAAATLLRWSPKKTENLVYRGLADLRQCLKTKGLEP
jgi:RNA polymerase sigma-70 factor (ECF subfamily)